METRCTLVTGPTTEPVTVDEVKTDRAVTHSLHDDLFTQYIQAAREMCESRTRRALMPQTWQQLCVNADTEINLEVWPVSEIVSISINGAVVDHAALIDDGTIYFGSGDSPLVDSDLFKGARVIILFKAGYADATEVPAALKKWMLAHIGSMYEYRESEIVANSIQRTRYIDGLLGPYKVRGFY